MNKIILAICLVSLMFSFTNLIPLSAMATLLIVFFPLLIYGKKKLNKICFSLILLMMYFFISTMIYYPQSFLEYDFYRRDGNVFITFAPLIVLTLIKFELNIEKIVAVFLFFITSINLIFMGIYFITGGTIFFFEAGIYHFLFEAHNAAGGFLMVITALCIGGYLSNKSKWYIISALINSISLYISDSRGSILALILAVVMFYLYKNGHESKAVCCFVFAQICLYGILYYYAPANFLDDNLMTVDIIDSDFISRGGTFINRGFYLWPRAIYLFLQSPIFGAGFGSYNDMPYQFTKIFGFAFNEATYGNVVFSDFHAHNTYLHVLAETGLVGILLLIYFLKCCNRFIKSYYKKGMSIALYITLWSIIFSSVTEHRLFTPSQMIPFVIILGLSVCAKEDEMEINCSAKQKSM